MLKKFSSIILIILILFTPISAASIEAEKQAVNSKIKSINNQLDAIGDGLQSDEDIDETIIRILSLDSELQDLIVSNYFYYKIAKIKQHDPDFQPTSLKRAPQELDPDYYLKLDEDVQKKFKSFRETLKKARYEANLANYKMSMAYLLIATKKSHDIWALFYKPGSEAIGPLMSRMFSRPAGKIHFGTKILAEIQTAYEMFLDQAVTGPLKKKIQKLFDSATGLSLDEATVMSNLYHQYMLRKSIYLSLFEITRTKIDELIQMHHLIYEMRNRAVKLATYTKLLELDLGRVRDQLGAGSQINMPPLSEMEEFNSAPFISALDDNLDNVMSGEITWDDYAKVKAEIIVNAEIVKEEKAQTPQVVRDYSEFEEYVKTFDKSQLERRERVLSRLEAKTSEWASATSDLITYYNTFDFSDDNLPQTTRLEISNDRMPEDIRDPTLRQTTCDTRGTPRIGNSSAEIFLLSCPSIRTFTTVKEIPTSGNGAWFEPFLERCTQIDIKAGNTFSVSNLALESQPASAKTSGTETIKPDFATLFIDSNQVSESVHNLEEMYEYSKRFPDYAQRKVNTLSSQVTQKLRRARSAKNSVESYADSVSDVYLPDDYCIYERAGGYSICEIDFVYEYIEEEVEVIVFLSKNIKGDCEDAEERIEDLLEFEQQKQDFITNLGSKSRELVNRMKPHQEFLQKTMDLKGAYQSYISGAYLDAGGSPSAQLSYINEKIDEVLAYEGLNEFISIQKEIRYITDRVRPADIGLSNHYRGSFAVLEEDKEAIRALDEVQYLEEDDFITLERLESGLEEVKQNLKEPYEEVVQQMERSKPMREAYDSMRNTFNYLQQKSEYYNNGEIEWSNRSCGVDYNAWMSATNIWMCQVLPAYAQSEGFEQDSQNRALYEEMKQTYLTIAENNAQLENEKREQGGYMRGVYCAYDDNPQELIPDDSLEDEDPMKEIIYPHYTPQMLEECGLEEYMDYYNQRAEKDYQIAQEKQESEEEMNDLKQSKNEGWDYYHYNNHPSYFYPNDEPVYIPEYPVGVGCETDPSGSECARYRFWIKESKEDGIDYFFEQDWTNNEYDPMPLSEYSEWMIRCESENNQACLRVDFWIKQSIKDGVDYLNPDSSGHYPSEAGKYSDYESESIGITQPPVEDSEVVLEEVNVNDFYNNMTGSVEGLPDFEQAIEVHKIESRGMQFYRINSRRQGKLLGAIPLSVEVQTFVDPQTMQVERTEQPWWGFLVS